MRLVLLGPPGAGKGTQAVQLSQRLKMPHLSTGEMLRQAIADGTPVGKHARQFIDQGQLVPDETVLELVRQRLAQPDCLDGWLLDGFPRTISQAEALDQQLAACQQPLDGVIEMQADDSELIRRLLARGRGDDRPSVIRQRLVTYQQQTRPLVDYYRQRQLVETVDAQATVEEVSARIDRAVQQLATRNGSRTDSSKVLSSERPTA